MISKLYKFLFKKPKIKKGEKLHYYDKVCDHLYFSWSDGLWFIKTTEGISISCGLEEFYRNKK
jgi:hypothetical protein